jgi:hypothetical protein
MGMRWEGQLVDEPAAKDLSLSAGAADGRAQAALFGRDVVTRTFDTPGFRGMTFYEVYAKSIINKVPSASRMPFQFTINPYRGCGHACVYCFARNTHTYLDLDSGLDFNSKIIRIERRRAGARSSSGRAGQVSTSLRAPTWIATSARFGTS